MIDWYALFWNSLWVVGASVLLAALSYHHWLAHEQGVRFRTQLETADGQRPLWAGFLLIAVGLAGTSPVWWETAVWGALALYAILNIYLNW